MIFAKTRMGAPGGAKKARFVNGKFASVNEGGNYRDVTMSAADIQKEKDSDGIRAEIDAFPL